MGVLGNLRAGQLREFVEFTDACCKSQKKKQNKQNKHQANNKH
jgi:hypothetical protein